MSFISQGIGGKNGGRTLLQALIAPFRTMQAGLKRSPLWTQAESMNQDPVKLESELMWRIKTRNRKNFTWATSHQFFFLLLAFTFYLFPPTSFAAIIFQDNFDNNCSGQDCNSSGGWSQVPTGWGGWWNCGSATYNGITHYAGEISSPGRNGTGKSLKIWRSPASENGYCGALTNTSPGSYGDFYMRFYAKLPTELNLNGNWLKLWRFNYSGEELYLNLNRYGSGPLRGEAELQLITGGSGWVTLLNSSQLLSLWDGQWHAWQFRFNLTAKTVTFWRDGVQISQVTLPNIPSGAVWNNYMQHFPLGNSGGTSWQSSWQAFEVDDLVIATTKAETDPVGGSTDTTPPTTAITAPSSGAAVSGTTTVNATASDNVGVAGVQFKVNGNNLGAEDTSSPYSTSWNTTSVPNGAYTLTATARDAAGNTTTSAPVTVTVSNAAAAPAVSLTANPASITSGQSSSLTWSSTNATSCTASGAWTGTKTTSGTQSVSPTANATYTLTCTGAGGTATQSGTITVSSSSGTTSTTFFSEGFENTNFASRGWYDITTGTLDTTERYSGNSSLRCTYAVGGTSCIAPKRHKFPESNSVYVSYRVKYSTNFVGSGKSYHPHEFLLLTNKNGDYDGPAFSRLTAYIESFWNSSSQGRMRLAFQDGQNVDQSRRGQNLIGVTENRGVAGCNGTPSGYTGDCYNRGDGVYVNGVLLDTPPLFTTANKNTWNHVEAYYELNSVSNGIGQANGIVRLWFNNTLVLERTNVIFRTGAHSDMQFNQFMFGPWIGDGSPAQQTMWVDDLVVRNARPDASPTPTFTSCNTLTLSTFSESGYNAYAPPFDLFAQNAPHVSVECHTGDPTTVRVTVGKVGDTSRLTYGTGYYYNPTTTSWTPYSGTCTGTTEGAWCRGHVTATITHQNINTTAQSPLFLVGYVCSIQNGAWRCGCRDTTCATSHWQLQAARR